MSVVPPSQLSLMRKRQKMKELIKSGHWSELIGMEAELFAEIDTAINDPCRSSRELLNELGSVVRVYRELSDICAESQINRSQEK